MLFDLLTDTRYGCGISEASLDLFDFYEISRYCNELIDDGKGGQEPRFSLNLLLNTRSEVYDVIQQLTSILGASVITVPAHLFCVRTNLLIQYLLWP